MTTDRIDREIERLPVSEIAGPLTEALRTSKAAIVTAAPGAGKSTLLPLILLQNRQNQPENTGNTDNLENPDNPENTENTESTDNPENPGNTNNTENPEGAGKIIVLEPRRVAARQIASRMAWLLGEAVGATVGYRIRQESRVSPATRIEVVTEGVLTRMLLDDPALEGTSLIIFDEFHERSLNTDEAFALTRQCQELLRDDLRIVVMSATIDTEALTGALHCPVLHSEGRMFPVSIVRAEEEADPYNVSQLVARTVLQAARAHEGDILAFLPGEAEIRRTAELLSNGIEGARICPLYGLLSNDQQAQAIAPSRDGERKVVLATPIAETSLTIEGVRVVIDSGLCRKMVFDAKSGLSHLETVRISLDMALQRTGRAGRVAPGVCYRLWTVATEHRMAPVRQPEIQDADLTSVVLDAALWGERRVESLPWLTPPPKLAAAQAATLLQNLGAIDAEGRATADGKALSRLPCHPRIARMLLTANSPERRALAADIAALLEEKDPMAEDADVSMARRIDALRSARRSGKPGRWGHILKTARQYTNMIHTREDSAPVNPYEAGLLLASAYPERIGKAWKEGAAAFLLAGGDLVAMTPSDPLSAAEWIVAASIHRRPGGTGRVFLASIVDPADLSAYVTGRDCIYWDAKGGTVVARREERIGAILLSTKPFPGDIRQTVQLVISEAMVKDGTQMLNFSDEVGALQRRIAFVAARYPELGLPEVDAKAVCQSAPEWGPLYIGKATTTAELKKIDLREVIWSRLTYEQQQAVERLAPTHITVPTGSRIRLDYRQGAEAPVLRVRLQECFGLLDTPMAGGAPVLMELLSPGFKPVQLTSDLRSFWETTYFEVRKELRRRYPKHAWPDNPLEARPVRGVGKRAT